MKTQSKLYEILHLIVFVVHDNTASFDVPDDVLRDLARLFLPKIIEMISTEEGRKQLEEWKAEQKKQKTS